MKVTRKDLIRIIKEELEAVNNLQEQEAEEVVQKAVAIKDNPKVQAVFDDLENNTEFQDALADPEIQAALQQLQSGINEVETPGPGAAVAGGMVGLSALRGLPYLLKGTAAGKAVLAALAPVLGVTGATVAAGAGALLIPIAIGYMIDKASSKKSAGKTSAWRDPGVMEMRRLIKQLRNYASPDNVRYARRGDEITVRFTDSMIGLYDMSRPFSTSEIQQLIDAGAEAQEQGLRGPSGVEKKLKELGP
jgi:hypothetical protein